MNILRSILLALASFFVLAQATEAHYDPNIGRWISRDPIGERGGSNLYGYVGNEPLYRFDPVGLEKLTLKYDLTDDRNYDHTDDAKSFVTSAKNLVFVNLFVDGHGKSFSAVFEQAKAKVGKYDSEGKNCNCIKLLIFVTHGSGANISPYDRSEFIEPSRLGQTPKKRQDNFESQAGVQALLKFKPLLCADGKVQFTTCHAGDDGLLQPQLIKAGIPLEDLNLKDGTMVFGVPMRELEGVTFYPSKK